jgi:hypothetical protein
VGQGPSWSGRKPSIPEAQIAQIVDLTLHLRHTTRALRPSALCGADQAIVRGLLLGWLFRWGEGGKRHSRIT